MGARVVALTQIDLLAEREMTAVLQLLQDIAQHLNVSTTVTPEQLRDLAKKTDLRSLTDRMEEITEPTPPALPAGPEHRGPDAPASPRHRSLRQKRLAENESTQAFRRNRRAGGFSIYNALRVTSTRWLVLLVLLVSLALLIPGLFAPVLTIRGVLTRDGIAQVAPTMLQKGLNDDTLNALKAMMNPTVVGLLEATGGDLRQMIIDKVTPSLTASLLQNVGDVEVFQQTRSIVGSVRRLYEVGSPVPATLILLFSVVVPFVKTALVGWAMFVAHETQRRRTLAFVEAIAKWSMADVFVVALFITYLAAMASQSTPLAGPPLVAFRAEFGAGFYWFAAYCVFSLASQQLTARVFAARV